MIFKYKDQTDIDGLTYTTMMNYHFHQQIDDICEYSQERFNNWIKSLGGKSYFKNGGWFIEFDDVDLTYIRLKYKL